MSTAETLHPGELVLRRLHAGEAVGDELRAHAQGCAECQARLERFSHEQHEFEQAISLERFTAGVERAARTPRTVEKAPASRVPVLLALAASALLVVGLGRLIGPAPEHGNRIKGGEIAAPVADLQIVVGGLEGVPHRPASKDPAVPEVLAKGERLRVGFMPAGHAYALLLSVDAQGTVTPVYAASGHELAPSPGSTATWMYDSLELTGDGLERLIALYSDEPLGVNEVLKAALESYSAAGGDLSRMAPLTVDAEQVHRTFKKP
jgi:hypothetical protein